MMWPLMIVLAAVATMLQAPGPRMANSDEPPGPGIPVALAEERARRLGDVRYELQLSIPEKPTERVRGRVTIRFDLADASRPLAIDFAPPDSVLEVTSRGAAVEPFVTTDHLVLPSSALRRGPNEVTLDFLAGDASLNRNPEFLYSLFVPARAHLAIPCFDQPDLKGRWTLSLDIPAGWEAVSNGAETSRDTRGGRMHLAFAETRPLPTYLFAFAAGRFTVETAERSGRVFRMLHRETDAKKVARNRDDIFDLHASALAWLERYTAIPYPWGKFDFLLVPSFQFGGMEHAGSIFYNASALLLDLSATQNQKLGRASLIAHETAHMWFGDLVTMRWFNDVWLKEVFANFMAAKIVNPAFPGINHDLRFLYAHYPAAYGVDRTPGTNAIRQRLENLNDAGTLYGAIIYQKAPIVMRQLETILGPAEMQEGLRAYLKEYEFGTATWTDLIAILDGRTPEDLAAWSTAWVREPGRRGMAARIEAAIRSGLDAAPTQSLKSAWFSALRDMALTADSLRWLERVWRKEADVPGLQLAEPDYINLALELAVREVPAWNEILELQQKRTENPDRRARFAFVRPALSPDPQVRDGFFESLRDVRNRRREPWVLEGLEYIHHPLRAPASVKYIRPSLDLLQEIQRTGDIFFPKRWTDATLGGHSSAEAARIVETFLDTLPASYPDRLRRIVLSSADDLFRAAGRVGADLR